MGKGDEISMLIAASFVEDLIHSTLEFESNGCNRMVMVVKSHYRLLKIANCVSCDLQGSIAR